MSAVQLTPHLLENFAGIYLSHRYDEPAPTPEFHRQAWALYCSDVPAAEVIAPRDHAKSTALTFDYILGETLFRISDYVILIGSTEEMAGEQLSNIREELSENEELRSSFGILEIEKDTTTDIIVRMTDGWRFRILARGAEQKIRGKMWKGKRPNLMVCDDMEDDEQVENRDRRAKFRRWFFRAAKQALSQSGKIRVHGTILHEDSLLNRLRKNSQWQHLYFKAHESFDDFSGLLWPGRWTEAKLRSKRQEFIDDQDAGGYSQEFLNDPADNKEQFLREEDFLPMTDDDYERPMMMGVGVDFGIGKENRHNRTSITVGGQCLESRLYIRDERVGRWDSLQIVEELISVQRAWNPSFIWVEDGHIWKAIWPVLMKEMERQRVFLNCIPRTPTKDKATRAVPFQKRHKARAMRFDKRTSWFEPYKDECLKFRVGVEALLDDQFDSTAHLVAGFESLPAIEAEDLYEPEEEDALSAELGEGVGRSPTTGY